MPMHVIAPSYIILDREIVSNELLEKNSLLKSLSHEVEHETEKT